MFFRHVKKNKLDSFQNSTSKHRSLFHCFGFTTPLTVHGCFRKVLLGLSASGLNEKFFKKYFDIRGKNCQFFL